MAIKSIRDAKKFLRLIPPGEDVVFDVTGQAKMTIGCFPDGHMYYIIVKPKGMRRKIDQTLDIEDMARVVYQLRATINEVLQNGEEFVGFATKKNPTKKRKTTKKKKKRRNPCR